MRHIAAALALAWVCGPLGQPRPASAAEVSAVQWHGDVGMDAALPCGDLTVTADEVTLTGDGWTARGVYALTQAGQVIQAEHASSTHLQRCVLSDVTFEGDHFDQVVVSADGRFLAGGIDIGIAWRPERRAGLAGSAVGVRAGRHFEASSAALVPLSATHAVGVAGGGGPSGARGAALLFSGRDALRLDLGAYDDSMSLDALVVGDARVRLSRGAVLFASSDYGHRQGRAMFAGQSALSLRRDDRVIAGLSASSDSTSVAIQYRRERPTLGDDIAFDVLDFDVAAAEQMGAIDAQVETSATAGRADASTLVASAARVTLQSHVGPWRASVTPWIAATVSATEMATSDDTSDGSRADVALGARLEAVPFVVGPWSARAIAAASAGASIPAREPAAASPLWDGPPERALVVGAIELEHASRPHLGSLRWSVTAVDASETTVLDPAHRAHALEYTASALDWSGTVESRWSASEGQPALVRLHLRTSPGTSGASLEVDAVWVRSTVEAPRLTPAPLRLTRSGVAPGELLATRWEQRFAQVRLSTELAVGRVGDAAVGGGLLRGEWRSRSNQLAVGARGGRLLGTGTVAFLQLRVGDHPALDVLSSMR